VTMTTIAVMVQTKGRNVRPSIRLAVHLNFHARTLSVFVHFTDAMEKMTVEICQMKWDVVSTIFCF